MVLTGGKWRCFIATSHSYFLEGFTFVVVTVSGGEMAAALAVVETPSGKDAIAEGLLDLLKPAVQQLDLHVHSVRWVASSKICASTSNVPARYRSIHS